MRAGGGSGRLVSESRRLVANLVGMVRDGLATVTIDLGHDDKPAIDAIWLLITDTGRWALKS
jgi:hypothetical protein